MAYKLPRLGPNFPSHAASKLQTESETELQTLSSQPHTRNAVRLKHNMLSTHVAGLEKFRATGANPKT